MRRTIFLVTLKIMRIIVASRRRPYTRAWLIDGSDQAGNIELLADKSAIVREVLLRSRQALFQGNDSLCRVCSVLRVRIRPVIGLDLCKIVKPKK